MAEANIEFTRIFRLLAEALGQPGQRTFRIIADSESSTANIWLEKEQLFQLALGIQRLTGSLTLREEPPDTIPMDREAPGLTKLDFKLGKLVLGHDSNNGLFLIDAYDLEDANETEATLRIWINRGQVEAFAEEAINVCAAGRPLCPLCGRAIDPNGHECPRMNGHAKRITYLEED